MKEPRIDLAAVRHVAKLACISLGPDELGRMQRELDAILGFMAELDSIEVAGVAPLVSSLPLPAALRPDEVVPGLARDQLLMAAPAHEHGGFEVPKVLDGD